MTSPLLPGDDDGGERRSYARQVTADEPTSGSAIPTWITDHPDAVDAIGAVGLFVLSVATAQSGRIHPEGTVELDPLGYALLAAMTLPLAVRRRRPEAVLAVTTLAMIPFLALDYRESFGGFGPLLALYTVAAHVERPRSLRVGGLAVAAFAGILLAGVLYEGEDLPPAAAVANLVMVVGVFAIGDALRSRRAYVAELQRRVEVAERLREEEAALAVAAERTRISRELHDVVAHGLSVMVVQAGAARHVLDRDPAAAGEALGQIERTGREAMAEMRRLLGVLRDGAGAGDELAPQPDLGALTALADSWRDAGLVLDLTVEGEVEDLPAGVALGAYRIVQEALTNAVRHAGPAHVEVRVVRRPDEVEVSVVDDGRGAASGIDRSGPDADGHGIVGMRERAAVLGGTLSAGPRTGGGWAVRAVLPIDPASPLAVGAPTTSAADEGHDAGAAR